MKFAELADYLQKLEAISLRNEITRVLAELLGKADRDEIDKLCYLLEGRVAPLYVNIEFGVSEKLILKAFPQIRESFEKIGDLGEAVYKWKLEVACPPSAIASGDCRRGSWKLEDNLLFETDKISTITDVHKILCEIASQSGHDSQKRKLWLLTCLLSSLTAVGAKYCVRIILGKLRLGFSDRTILDSLSWAATGNKSLRPELEDLYHVNPDIGLVARNIKGRSVQEIKEMARSAVPIPGMPVVMALCERAGTPEEAWGHINNAAACEDKYDGLRCQVHKNKQEITIFSRNMENTTAMYPELVAAVKSLPTETLIMEGEAVAYDRKTGDCLAFQETAQRKRKYDIAEKAAEIPLRLYVFELLYINGRSLLYETYETRRQELVKLLKAQQAAQLQLAAAQTVSSLPELEKIFLKKTGTGMEGVIVKQFDGIYAAGARDFNWIKIKRGFQGQKITDTIDCVVMGYDWGKGKRTAFGIGGFLVGIFDPATETYQTLAKIGTGLRDEEWQALRVQSSEFRVQEKPKNYDVKKEMECNVWVEPKIVVEIKADEITKSDLHTAGNGLSLRFPRFMGFRPDKKSEETTTPKELLTVFFGFPFFLNHQR